MVDSIQSSLFASSRPDWATKLSSGEYKKWDNMSSWEKFKKIISIGLYHPQFSLAEKYDAIDLMNRFKPVPVDETNNIIQAFARADLENGDEISCSYAHGNMVEVVYKSENHTSHYRLSDKESRNLELSLPPEIFRIPNSPVCFSSPSEYQCRVNEDEAGVKSIDDNDWKEFINFTLRHATAEIEPVDGYQKVFDSVYVDAPRRLIEKFPMTINGVEIPTEAKLKLGEYISDQKVEFQKHCSNGMPPNMVEEIVGLCNYYTDSQKETLAKVLADGAGLGAILSSTSQGLQATGFHVCHTRQGQNIPLVGMDACSHDIFSINGGYSVAVHYIKPYVQDTEKLNGCHYVTKYTVQNDMKCSPGSMEEFLNIANKIKYSASVVTAPVYMGDSSNSLIGKNAEQLSPQAILANLNTFFTSVSVERNKNEFIHSCIDAVDNWNESKTYNIPDAIRFDYRGHIIDMTISEKKMITVKWMGKCVVFECPYEKAKNRILSMLLHRRTGLTDNDVYLKEDGALHISGNINLQDLSGLNLRGATIKNASFNNVSFNKTVIEDTEIIDSKFKNLNMGMACFKSTNMDNVYFEKVNASGLDILRTQMKSVTIEGSNFCNAKISHSKISSNSTITTSDFIESDVYCSEIDLSVIMKSNFSDSTFDQVNISDTTMHKLKLNKSEWSNLYLEGVAVEHSVMDEMSIINSQLNKCSIENSSMWLADFSDSTIENVRLDEQNLGQCTKQPRII